MSKKINLHGKSLSLTTYWFIEFQLYGKNFFLFKKYFFLLFFLRKFITKKKLLFLSFFFGLFIKFSIFKKRVYFLISLFKSKKKFDVVLQNIFPVYLFRNKSLLQFTGKIFIFPSFYFSQLFLKDLIFFLLIYKKFNPRKVFNYFLLFLKKKINYLSIVSSRKGIIKKKLVGFKIQLKGRFETTKNSMSKKNLIKFGKLNSTTLENHIVLCEHTFFSKLGSSNLKIWLFYSF